MIRRVAAERPPESDVDAAWSRAVEELALYSTRRAPVHSDVRNEPRRIALTFNRNVEPANGSAQSAERHIRLLWE